MNAQEREIAIQHLEALAEGATVANSDVGICSNPPEGWNETKDWRTSWHHECEDVFAELGLDKHYPVAGCEEYERDGDMWDEERGPARRELCAKMAKHLREGDVS